MIPSNQQITQVKLQYYQFFQDNFVGLFTFILRVANRLKDFYSFVGFFVIFNAKLGCIVTLILNYELLH
jgi:hypothetical protein